MIIYQRCENVLRKDLLQHVQYLILGVQIKQVVLNKHEHETWNMSPLFLNFLAFILVLFETKCVGGEKEERLTCEISW